MLPQVPEPVRHPTVARAAVSPSALVVTAAGFLIGLAAQSLTLAIVLAVVAWLGRMVVALAQARRRGRRLPLVTIDPVAVSEPWRQYVREALAAEQRFDQAVAQWPEGPLRDRLALLQPRLRRATGEVWTIAQQGAALDGTVRGVRIGTARPSIDQLSGELRAVQAERQQTSAADRQAALARSEEAIAAQLRAARRSEAVRSDVLDRLRLLTAQLDEAVTRLLSLGLDRPSEAGTVEEVAGSIDALLGEMDALQQGLQAAEAAAAGAGAATAGSVPEASSQAPGGALPGGPTGVLPPAGPSPGGLDDPPTRPEGQPPPPADPGLPTSQPSTPDPGRAGAGKEGLPEAPPGRGVPSSPPATP
jgi:hypothetical protein